MTLFIYYDILNLNYKNYKKKNKQTNKQINNQQ